MQEERVDNRGRLLPCEECDGSGYTRERAWVPAYNKDTRKWHMVQRYLLSVCIECEGSGYADATSVEAREIEILSYMDEVLT